MYKLLTVLTSRDVKTYIPARTIFNKSALLLGEQVSDKRKTEAPVEGTLYSISKSNNDKVPNLKKMNITHVVAEIYPLASVGGYSKVVHALTNRQSKSDRVNIITPYYSSIPKYLEKKVSRVYKFKATVSKTFNIEYATYSVDKNLTIYLVKNDDYFNFRTNVYGYTDDANRWAYLSFCALELINQDVIKSDIIHTHDWHTGILQNIKHEYYPDIKAPVVFTIHNLKYQAMFDHHNSDLRAYDKWQKLPLYNNIGLQKLNYIKRAIKYADSCVFVSKGYLTEVLNGVNDELLLPLLKKEKRKLTYVLNRVDSDFNPVKSDIFKQYNVKNYENKSNNKTYLQKKLGLTVGKQTPLICFVGRLSEQKGILLLIDTLDVILRNSNAQFIQLGGGDNNYIPKLIKLQNRYKGRVYIYGKSDFKITPQVYASSDICVVPSKFEPCGIVPMEAQIFGCVPVVNSTGGLNDTTIDYLDDKQAATGFIFKGFDKENFIFTLSKALELFNNKPEWERLIKNAMLQDFSWDKSACEYKKIYKHLINK